MRDMYKPTQHLPPLGRSDHNCLLLVPKQKEKAPTIPRKVRLLSPGKVNVLCRKLILEDWSEVFNVEDVNEKVNAFTSMMLSIMDETIPEKTVRMHTSDKPWMTSFIKSKIKARQRAFSCNNQARYEKLCSDVSKLINNAKISYYKRKAKDFRTTSPQKWYKSIFLMLGINNGNNVKRNVYDENVLELAEKLQQVFTKPWLNQLPNYEIEDNLINQTLKDIKPPLPSIGQVKSCLQHLNPRKATGDDKIPAWILKRFCEDLAPVVHNIVTTSIKQCKYPSQYKHALITPVAKVNNPSNVENDFRPISVLPQMAKVIDKLQLHLNKSDFKIKTNQHAFTHGRSTVSALISMTQNWYNATDNSQLGRTQQVNLQGAMSSIQPCSLGVPQGAVISPVLFNVYINDLKDNIPKEIDANTCKYADDCTQNQIVERGECSSMQKVIDELRKWADNNRMALNPKKNKGYVDMLYGLNTRTTLPIYWRRRNKKSY
ncbi:uncharacterized protein LOC124454918 [Xenia sp. Carnegie-2017]|uniref:uncharacterized protein LOC124454918 n=1 Tax=Xenia sp. Carnegie-2017 TaxID=2897299 RepID=UPI001F04E69A|nr:uncharacterized protein LOC124454918 [Xenia sp. Carnegie-2017]